MHAGWGMPYRGSNGKKRRVKGECHGMQVRFTKAELEARHDSGAWVVPTAALERLAAWLQVAPQPKEGETEGERRQALIHAVLREEKRLSDCPRTQRWEVPRGPSA